MDSEDELSQLQILIQSPYWLSQMILAVSIWWYIKKIYSLVDNFYM